MAVKLRLMRMGKKKQPTYRIVAADSRSPRDGRFIEVIGTYAPREEPSVVLVDQDKALSWLGKGAQPTETVKKLLEISGAWGEFARSRPAPSEKVRTRAPRSGASAKKAPAKKAPAQKAAAPVGASATGEASEDLAAVQPEGQ